MNITICENLKELRKKKNNSQEDLADFLTVSIAAVSKWERGECYPDIELLPRIAAFYDTTVDDLLGVGEVKKKEKLRKYRKQTPELTYMSNESQNLLKTMADEHFDFCRDDERFAEIRNRLTAAACKSSLKL